MRGHDGFYPNKFCSGVYAEGRFGTSQVLQLPTQMKHLI